MKKNHYLVLFLIGFLVLWPFMLHKLYTEQAESVEAFIERIAYFPEEDETVGNSGETGTPSEKPNEEVSENDPEAESGSIPENGPAPKNGTVSGNGTGPENETVSGNDTVSGDETVSGNEIIIFSEDTLFIGDSRTMGLVEYADLGGASVFASTGMSIYKLYSTKNAVKDQPALLEDMLEQKQYQRIYMMLGINELGYREDQTFARYEEELVKLLDLQPDAKIILEANLHVTTAKSGRDKIFNNGNIDRFNENIRQLAEKYGLSYIDVNEVFDDETGGLNPEYTHDGVHVLAKYYQQWGDWIREN